MALSRLAAAGAEQIRVVKQALYGAVCLQLKGRIPVEPGSRGSFGFANPSPPPRDMATPLAPGLSASEPETLSGNSPVLSQGRPPAEFKQGNPDYLVGVGVMSAVLALRQGARFAADTSPLNPVSLGTLSTKEKAWVWKYSRGLASIAPTLPTGKRIYEKTLVQVFNMDTVSDPTPYPVVSLHPMGNWKKRSKSDTQPYDHRQRQERQAKNWRPGVVR